MSVKIGSVDRLISPVSVSSTTSSRWPRMSRRASRKRGDSVVMRTCGRGRTNSSSSTKITKVNEFNPKAHAAPRPASTAAPSTGPMARPRLNDTEFSDTAGSRSSAETSRGTNARIAGAMNAIDRPSSADATSSTHWSSRPVAVMMARIPATVAETICEAISSLRRSQRSAALPVQGARNSAPPNSAKFMAPTQPDESVSSNITAAPAMFWNHVPMLLTRFPMNSQRMLGCRRMDSADEAAGSSVRLT